MAMPCPAANLGGRQKSQVWLGGYLFFNELIFYISTRYKQWLIAACTWADCLKKQAVGSFLVINWLYFFALRLNKMLQIA
jgi:hypothetical protein